MIEAYSYFDKSAFWDTTLLEVVQDNINILAKKQNVMIILFIVLVNALYYKSGDNKREVDTSPGIYLLKYNKLM